MDDSPSVRTLHEALHTYGGKDACGDVLAPWLEAGAAGFRELTEPVAVYGAWSPNDDVDRQQYTLLEQLYALSRVNDALLLAFQPAAVDDRLSVSVEQYLDFFAALGVRPVEPQLRQQPQPHFDPFLHEIVTLRQDPERTRPIRLEAQLWPALMFGEMLFSRGGAAVAAGEDHAEKGVADAAPLYWTFRRSYRGTMDLSHGWGHNSQWATDFRRDYRTADADLLNVDGTERAETPDDTWEPTSLLTAAERCDLVRHRSLIRVPEAYEALAREPGGDTDLMPFSWRLTVPRGR